MRHPLDRTASASLLLLILGRIIVWDSRERINFDAWLVDFVPTRVATYSAYASMEHALDRGRHDGFDSAWGGGPTGRHHLKLIHYFNCFLDVESQRLKARMDVYLTLLRYLILGYDIQVCEWLMEECCHIISLLKDLGVYIAIYKLKEFFKYTLYILYFFKIWCYQWHLSHKLLLFLLISPIMVMFVTLI